MAQYNKTSGSLFSWKSMLSLTEYEFTDLLLCQLSGTLQHLGFH